MERKSQPNGLSFQESGNKTDDEQGICALDHDQKHLFRARWDSPLEPWGARPNEARFLFSKKRLGVLRDLPVVVGVLPTAFGSPDRAESDGRSAIGAVGITTTKQHSLPHGREIGCIARPLVRKSKEFVGLRSRAQQNYMER